MNDKNFDKFIKDKLYQSEAPVPADMWQRIHGEEKKRRVGGWFFNYKLLAVAILLFVAAGSFWAINTKTKGIFMAASPNDSLEVNAEKDGTLAARQNDVTKSIIADSTVEIKEADKMDSRNSSSEKPSTEEVLTTTKGTPSKSEKFAGQNNKNKNDNPLNNKVASERIVAIKSGKTQSSNKNKKAGKKLYTVKNNYAQQQKSSSDISIVNTTVKTQGTNENNSLTKAKNYSLELARLNFTHKLFTVVPPKINKAIDVPFIKCPRFDAPNNNWYVEAYVSGDYTLKNQQASVFYEKSKDYIQQKDSTESKQVSYSAGIRVTRQLSKNLLLKAGVNFSQINEKFYYEKENSRRTVTVVTLHTIINAPGDTTRFSDTSSVIQIGYRKVTSYNTYRFIDIPLLLSYEAELGGMKVGINAGPVFNIKSWSAGNMIDTTGNIAAINKEGNRQFKNSIGLGFYGSLSIIKPITPRLDVFAEPYFRYNFSNLTNISQPFTLRTSTAGLQFGIRFKLNGGQQ